MIYHLKKIYISALDVNLQMPSLTEQCLPSLWNMKRTEFPCNSNDNFSDNSFVNALQTFDCDRQSKGIFII